ncbi:MULTISPECIES: hypothetical protein [Nostocales]|uniref:Uncharacterized protein n=1 Tax=Dolichospermum flos-aquae UHCC 0037 TaxID=2590026 RepID=A0ACC7S4Z2_DOLFA|nr:MULTISPECIES: hypothetical protein [Nostocales]MBO1067609.1 hypothetical protein [Anabaena sp. 54]MTJ43598.1 hypothetical protein [Dolichospermum flos-aquae UHCC 0037]OBQ16858.1 MAG: hypothetical protein AN486_17365 [Anabaena sp. AL93]
MITLQEIINSLASLSKEDQDFLFEILRKRREEETKQVIIHSLLPYEPTHKAVKPNKINDCR